MQPLHGSGEVAVAAEQPVVAASVFKVLGACVVESRFAQRQLDRRERVALPAAGRTPGQVGVHTLNAAAAELGLDHTHVVSDLQTMLDSIGHDAGFGDYACLAAWQPDHPEDPALADVEQRVRSSAALDPARATRTTSRDMVRLLRGIWTDQAGPAEACARVRDLMAHQLTPHRLASGFGPPVRVAASSGGLLGVVRNEDGVINYPDGHSYLAAVFTRAGTPNGGEAAINTAIVRAAAAAVSALRHQDTVSPENDAAARPSTAFRTRPGVIARVWSAKRGCAPGRRQGGPRRLRSPEPGLPDRMPCPALDTRA